MPPAADREHDLLLLGATGYVGRLTAQHLAGRASGVRVALAGRSPERLAALRNDLGDAARDWPLVVLDVTDLPALDHAVRSTRLLVSTIGPYVRHGLPVVQACAEHGTDYADLTGETLFAWRSVKRAHARAEQTGARIVHSCGFDSIPSDLGVGLTAARAATDGAGTLTDTVLHVRAGRGGISGGTVDSLRQQAIEVQGDRGLRHVLADPYALAGDDATRRPSSSGPPVRRDPRSGRWQAPFVMGGYNRQVVWRSDALLGHAYGPGFTYREVIDTGRGPLGAVAAAGVLAATTTLLAGMSVGPTRRLLDAVLPDPGEGPSEATRRSGHFRLEVEAGTTSGARYRTTIAAPYDPGYGGTAVMLGESALALLQDPVPARGGVLTPMTALGEHLAVRLRGQRFTIATEQVGQG